MSDTAQPWHVANDPSVVGLTAPNPGPKTLNGTHTYIVGRQRVYIIDPGPPQDAHLAALTGWMARQKMTPAAILLTHGHPDHAPGARTLARALGTGVWASSLMPAHEAEEAGVTGRFVPDHEFLVEGHPLAVLATPGHKPDHVAFWLPNSGLLFAGDTVLGAGSSLIAPPDGDMQDYLRTLHMLRELRPRLIAPGHGPLVTDPDTRISTYLRHRQEREQQVLAALEQKPGSVDDIVERVYTDVDPALHDLARGSVAAQLEKLEGEGKVRLAANVYTLT